VATGFGHFGYGGSGAWCDPKQRLAVAMITNDVKGGPFGDARIALLGASAVRCARSASRGELQPAHEEGFAAPPFSGARSA
jgi:CubicO group peptidase (beta-lactamase class C family)